MKGAGAAAGLASSGLAASLATEFPPTATPQPPPGVAPTVFGAASSASLVFAAPPNTKGAGAAGLPSAAVGVAPKRDFGWAVSGFAAPNTNGEGAAGFSPSTTPAGGTSSAAVAGFDAPPKVKGAAAFAAGLSEPEAPPNTNGFAPLGSSSFGVAAVAPNMNGAAAPPPAVFSPAAFSAVGAPKMNAFFAAGWASASSVGLSGAALAPKAKVGLGAEAPNVNPAAPPAPSAK
jgi:hypothetical protein